MTTLIKLKNNRFEDNSEEITELTGRIKYDTRLLTKDLDMDMLETPSLFFQTLKECTF